MDTLSNVEFYYYFSDSIDIIPLTEAIQTAKVIGENFKEQLDETNTDVKSIYKFYREIYSYSFHAGFVEWYDITGEYNYNMCQCHDCAHREEIPLKYYISSCPGEFIVCDKCISNRDFIKTQITNALAKYIEA
jgi:hypothetical protein